MRELVEWLGRQLAVDGTGLELQPASADASFRQYYRLHSGRGGDRRSLIVMDASAEAASCKPFVEIARLLAAGGLHVPEIVAEDLTRGWLLLSDLGTQTYLEVLDNTTADRLFAAAIDALIDLQRIECPAHLPRYDAALLRRELELFPEWYLQRHLGLTVDAELRATLDDVFSILIESALAQPRVLVHRDYMPRNLMISEPLPGVLDFQDAVCGPISYDPICLFKDAFISWPEERVEYWLQNYWSAARAAKLAVPEQFSAFYRDCDLMGAQRHLKVIGIFARICHRDGKPKYLQDVPRFFAYLRGVCARRPELAALATLFNKLPVPA